MPAQLGYPAARVFTLLICLESARQTWRLAEELKLRNAVLAIPFIFLQPSFFLLCATTMTEPLFALIFVIALRLHHKGEVRAGMLAASLLITVRPEGFFIGLLWGLWILQVRGRRALPEAAALGAGAFLWWAAAYVISGDPFWILHNWPVQWKEGAHSYGPIWWFAAQTPLIAGPLLLPAFFAGFLKTPNRREGSFAKQAFILLFVLHSVMYWRGWFGSTGYARYLVCVSPAIALITLQGWDRMIKGKFATAILLAGSFIFCLFYVDGWTFSRDARAIEQMHGWFKSNEVPVSRLVTSQAYMRIAFDRSPAEMADFTNDRERNLKVILDLPDQTLVFWDDDTGPKWYGLRAEDFETAGFQILKAETFQLSGLFFSLNRDGYGGIRRQRLSLLHKSQKRSGGIDN